MQPVGAIESVKVDDEGGGGTFPYPQSFTGCRILQCRHGTGTSGAGQII